ncbi:hypothetical protein DDQ50_12805 [Amnibacterium flavum]|uniref:ABC transporter domain-containing protein n=1 Tax=Amnibacterium flavum TaxID=2173173 RepID=A0A2V1HV70_9MICO|nr:hypothetical protein DDQ50_12805 [Amnibacterium flavum]
MAAVLVGALVPAVSAQAISTATPEPTDSATVPDESAFVEVAAGPGQPGTIEIDTSTYLPDVTPAPAVLLAHGFGGSKLDLAAQAVHLRDLGYVVLTYTARGFGESGGLISLDSLDYEVADARALVDVLAERDDVIRDGADPEVAVAGGSYGGALALMLGATDPRIDTVVAAITWNDLASALVPNAVRPDAASAEGDTPAPLETDQPGVFKQAWASQLFGAGASPDSACGRFTPELCELYSGLIAGYPLDDGALALLDRSSPASVLDEMTAPTLLLQGTQDSLFGLDQADANARQIDSAGADVKVVWFEGGHDAGGQASGAGESTEETTDAWLAEHLPVDGGSAADDAAGSTFVYSVPSNSTRSAETQEAPSYPGLSGADGVVSTDVPIGGVPTTIANPPGGLPAVITSLPGLGSLLGGLGAAALSAPQPGQTAAFVSAELTDPVTLVGSPSVTVRVSRGSDTVDSDVPTGGAPADSGAVLFVALYTVDGDNRRLVGGTVAPVRIADLAADGTPVSVDVALPASAATFTAGTRLAVSVGTTDALYRSEPAAARYTVDATGVIALPTVPTATTTDAKGVAPAGTLLGIAGVLVIAALLGLVALVRGRRRARIPASSPAIADPAAPDAPPLVLRGLVKNFRNGQRAVDDLSFTVRKGQVLGLLGPNGAGKTTTLRMAVGLLRPDAGTSEIFGETVRTGAAVLTRVGTFIEGPGFLPHLSGRRNLELFWAASGRALSEARMDEALMIADLGPAISRKVRGYSQGMRQRLAIAQAMLGMPELLILDEPTNGLDPPQIHALRGVLRRYAESGRTVIVSSHLLGEVEQTCTDVVVMARGRLIAAGTVAELAGEAGEVTFEVTDGEAALAVVSSLEVEDARLTAATTLRVAPGSVDTESIVAALVAAGVGVRSVVRGRHLEETFLDLVDPGSTVRR